MGKVSGIRAVLALRDALDRQGLSRTSKLNGGAISGWIEKNRYGSTGFSIRPRPDGRLDWHLVVSGKPHMRYRSYKEAQGDEVYELHEPVNPEVVFPKIRAAFAELGIAAEDVRECGWQTMWDDDVDFEVTTAHPEWLSGWDPANRETALPDAPLLMSGSIERYAFGVPVAEELPLYRLGEERFALTREGAEAVVAAASGLASDRWVKYGKAEFDGRRLVLSHEGRTTGIDPVEITNHWGDRVEVYPMPSRSVIPARRYGSQIRVMVGGEWTVPGFAVLDGQHGGAPWNEEVQAAAPRP